MKVKYNLVEVKEVEEEIPDEFAYDDSVKGAMVDILLEEMCYTSRKKLRMELFENDKTRVKSAIATLKRCYNTIDTIEKILELKNDNV